MYFRLIFTFLLLLSSNSQANSVKADMGKCNNVDYHLALCKPINCAFNLPSDKEFTSTIQLTVQGMHENFCYYRMYYQINSPKFSKPKTIKVNCVLSEKGQKGAIEQVQSYKKGNLGVLLKGPKNEVMIKECNTEAKF